MFNQFLCILFFISLFFDDKQKTSKQVFFIFYSLYSINFVLDIFLNWLHKIIN